jgi:CRP/FNR family transcriptional regulator, cyclic AMP receptor protein
MAIMLSSIAAKTARLECPPLAYHPELASRSTISPYGLPVDDRVSDILHRSQFGRALSQASLADLDRMAHATAYPQDSVIFVEGQQARGVFVVCQGRAKLTTTNKDGKTLILKLAEPGEILGLHAAVTGAPYEFTLETLQASQLAFIPREDFLRFLKHYPDACLMATQQISSDCQAAYEVIRSIGLSHTAPERLARLLLQWSRGGQFSTEGIRLKLVLTHEELAQLIGTTRETVTRTLSQFKKQRVLELTGATLVIRNMAALQEMANS